MADTVDTEDEESFLQELASRLNQERHLLSQIKASEEIRAKGRELGRKSLTQLQKLAVTVGAQPDDILDRTANPGKYLISFGFSAKRGLIALIISLTVASVESSATVELELLVDSDSLSEAE